MMRKVDNAQGQKWSRATVGYLAASSQLAIVTFQDNIFKSTTVELL